MLFITALCYADIGRLDLKNLARQFADHSANRTGRIQKRKIDNSNIANMYVYISHSIHLLGFIIPGMYRKVNKRFGM